MKSTPVQPTLTPENRPWYVCAMACVGLGVMFSAIFAIGLFHFSVSQNRVIDQYEADMLVLDAEVQASPSDPAVLGRLRDLDSRLRFLWFYRIKKTTACALMLLISMIVLVGAVKWTYVLSPENPSPEPRANATQAFVTQSRLGRLAVGGAAVGFVVFFGIMAVQGQRLLIPEPALATHLVTEPNEAAPLVTQPSEEIEALSVATEEELAKNWYRFRGKDGAGIVHVSSIPTTWNGTDGTGIAWKVPIPGEGNNSPIIWGNRIFCAGTHEDKLQVYCFDGSNGTLLWTGEVPTNPEAADMDVMEDTGMSACTMATDGHHVYAIFASGDIGCFDFSGKELWHKALGVPDSSYGYASSLDVYQNRVIVQFDHGADDDELSRLLAIDGATGEIVQDKVRPVANVWTSPIVTRIGEQDQVIVVSDPWTMAYDANSFEELWRAECVGGDLAASPIVAGGLIYAIEPYSQLVAIKPDGRGNVTDSHIAWVWEEGGPDVTSPVSNGQWICLLDTGGEAFFVNAKDGSSGPIHDFKGMFQASPSLVGDVLYVLDEDGVMTRGRVKEDMTVEVLGSNPLGEKCLATPAFAEGQIVIRSETHLWCIGQAMPATSASDSKANPQQDVGVAALSVASDQDLANNWYRFRGKDGAGIVHVTDIPQTWNGTDGTGILWKRPIPGEGNNSPITWGNRIFCAGTHEDKLQVYCFDGSNGTLLWTGEVPTNPEAADMDVMEDTGMSACTMATDGHHVYAIFASGDIGCFDFSGKKLWHKALGIPDSSYGYASSLDVYQNRVIVQFDHGADDDELSRLLAIDGATGEIVQDKVRPVANVWTSPIVTRIGDQDQVIVVADPWTMAYDAKTFKELWRAECVGGDLAASPIYAGGLIFAIEPYSQLVAIKPDGRGDITDTHIAWIWEEGGPDITSPVSNGQWICLLDTGGEAFFVNAKDGSSGPIHDFKGMFQASPSLVDDVLYVLDEDGVMTRARVKEDMAVEVLGTNPLGEKCLATPAFAQGRIYIRSVAHLWCIGK